MAVIAIEAAAPVNVRVSEASVRQASRGGHETRGLLVWRARWLITPLLQCCCCSKMATTHWLVSCMCEVLLLLLLLLPRRQLTSLVCSMLLLL